MIEDIGGLHHLHHKGGVARRQVIGGTDTGEDTVDGPQDCLVGRHIAADVGQDHDERGLAHVGGLAAHIGAGNDEHLALCVHAQVIGDKGL